MSEPKRIPGPAGVTVLVYPDRMSASEAAAERLAALVRAKPSAVLGLATGSTPIAIYRSLVERHRSGTLSFRDACTYNLDEYYPIGPNDPNSYRYFMNHHLFSHVDLPANRAHVLDGTVPERAAAEHAAQFDRWIEADGGLDVQLLGIGRNGHIGFNEPSGVSVETALGLPTRLVELHPVTTADAAKDFGGDEAAVPKRALTVGVGPILAARSILILAFGANKADAVAKALRGPMTAELPASLLQAAGERVTWLLDPEAAVGLGS